MAGNYRLVFDLASTPDRWGEIVSPLLILTVIAFALLVTPQIIIDRLLPSGPKKLVGKLFGAAFFLLIVSIAATWTYGHFSQSRAYKSLETEGKLSFVEGCLQGFHPMPENGHDYEIVRVNGREFSYSDFDVSSPAFNNTTSHGGPIHADSAVKIWHAGNNIVKLEVRDHACPNAPDIAKHD